VTPPPGVQGGNPGAGPAPGTAPAPEAYLAAADRLLTDTVSGTHGTWPRACAWLIRLALETELTRFWEAACPPAAGCRSRRAQFLLLSRYAGPETSRRAEQAWSALSRAGHHGYEMGLTAAELRSLTDEVAAVLAALRLAGQQPRSPDMRLTP
jgi:hypothetical protein